MAAAAPISFTVRVDARGLQQTVDRALRDVEKVRRVALVRAANMVRGYMLQAVQNNGDVVFKKTGEQIVPPFKAKSTIHDLLHGQTPPAVLAAKESVLLRVNSAAGTAQVGWAGTLAQYVERWQDGTVGGETRLARPETRHAIYRQVFARRPQASANDREFVRRLLHTAPKQPRRDFVDAIAAFVGPRLAGWVEGATKSAIERRNDRYLDQVMGAPDLPLSARIADARAAGVRVKRRRATRQRRR